jgi:hypothetical protein
MGMSLESGERRLAVIVGAGASYDCGMRSEIDPQWRPPLAKDLFINRVPSFTNILRQYPGAENLAEQIRSGVERGVNLETILRSLSESANLGTRRDFLQVPLYIQHLIGEVSANYIRSGATAFNTLIRMIDESHYAEVLYLTVNYDLFLDQALERHYRFKFGDIADYVTSGEKWRLIKLHGSVQWSRRLLNAQTARIGTDPVAILDEMGISDLQFGEIELRAGHKETHRFRNSADGVLEFAYPALAVPVEQKDEFVCPPGHAKTAKAFLSDCTDFLVLGFSGLDTHVLRLLKDVPCVNRFTIVNEDHKSAQEAIERICAVNPLFSETPGEYPANGFAAFTGQGHLEAFLSHAHVRQETI